MSLSVADGILRYQMKRTRLEIASELATQTTALSNSFPAIMKGFDMLDPPTVQIIPPARPRDATTEYEERTPANQEFSRDSRVRVRLFLHKLLPNLGGDRYS